MSITAVPLQPTPKGVLARLWFGVAACVALAGGLAWAGTRDQAGGGSCGPLAFDHSKGVSAPMTTASGLRFQTVKAGQGPKPTDADVALISYKGMFPNGKVFDENQHTPLPVAQVVPGFSEALKLMQPGGSYRVCIPPKLGYGSHVRPGGPIPANATLLFAVDLLDFKSLAELQQRMQQQQMMQQQGAQPQGGQSQPQN